MERFAWKARVLPGMLSEYIRRHDEIWPEMTAVLNEAGIRNYTIWTTGEELFGYYECDSVEHAAKVNQTVRLTWSGATSANIDVYRDGVLIATTPDDGQYDDSTGDTGRARYTYQVCEAGTQICSNEATVTFPQ